jgi:Flp pilus assembly protein TadG
MRARHRPLALPRQSRGLAAVELALLLPIMLFLMFGTAELGRVLYQYNTLTKSVRDAAQYLARAGMIVGTQVLSPTDAQEATAKNLVVYGSPAAGEAPLLPGLETDDVTISYQKLYGSGADNAVKVTVVYEYQALVGWLPDVFTLGGTSVVGGAPTLTAQIVMRGV